jgi:glycosyltransferase involved in cell wall biosynthesis
MTFPETKTSWLRRLALEWFGFKKISQQVKTDLWLSLHDITPRVTAGRQAVYCHNPSIFYRISLREAFQEPVFLLFNLFYGFLYGAFIKRNSHIIVQQEWLRQEFLKRYGHLPIVVAHPSEEVMPTQENIRLKESIVFLYPALPRVFKNIEVLGEAANILHKRKLDNFEIRVTTSGAENKYAKWLKKRFDKTPGLRFIGRQDVSQMSQQYSEASAVVFPSRLETWGLPITEAKSRCLPLLVADAPYARETVGAYDDVSFFPANKAEALADQMHAMINGTWQPMGGIAKTPQDPFAQDWPQLIRLLTLDFDTQAVSFSN